MDRSHSHGLSNADVRRFAATLRPAPGATALVLRAADFASFMNIKIADVVSLFAAALHGDDACLRPFGVALSGGSLADRRRILMGETARLAGDFERAGG